jgi:hypothetical protein
LNDIVERLRQKDYATRPVNPDGYEAADEIVRLRADKTLLIDSLATAVEDAQEAEAERDRLRDALCAARAAYVQHGDGDAVTLIADIIDAALKGDTQ